MIQEIKSSQYWKHPEVDMGIIELPRYQQTRRQIILYSLFFQTSCVFIHSFPYLPLKVPSSSIFNNWLLISIQYSSSNWVKDTISILNSTHNSLDNYKCTRHIRPYYGPGMGKVWLKHSKSPVGPTTKFKEDKINILFHLQGDCIAGGQNNSVGLAPG